MAVAVSASMSTALQIRWLRDKQLTQNELAKRAGISQQQIARHEKPNANPTVKTLQSIAIALGVKYRSVLY